MEIHTDSDDDNFNEKEQLDYQVDQYRIKKWNIALTDKKCNLQYHLYNR